MGYLTTFSLRVAETLYLQVQRRNKETNHHRFSGIINSHKCALIKPLSYCLFGKRLKLQSIFMKDEVLNVAFFD